MGPDKHKVPLAIVLRVYQQYEEYEAKIYCTLWKAQCHHATTHGDHACPPGGGKSV